MDKPKSPWPFQLVAGSALFAALLIAAPSLAAAENEGQPAAAQVGAVWTKIVAGAVPQNLDELRDMQAHVQDLAAKIEPATVSVRVGQAQGSGVIISEDGFVLSAAHVVQRPGRNVTFTLSDGRRVRGKTLGMNRNFDAGLMKLDPLEVNGQTLKWPHLEMAPADSLKGGLWCIATGHPGGYQQNRRPVLRLGRILDVDESAITTDCTLVGGDSGGPLLDLEGRVIGVHSRIGTALTANMHVPIAAYTESWDRLVKSEEWGRLPGPVPFGAPMIGVQGADDADNAKIAAVFPGSPAAKAGLESGDVVTRFGDERIADFGALQAAVARQNPGDQVRVEVLRNGQTVRLLLTIGRQGG